MSILVYLYCLIQPQTREKWLDPRYIHQVEYTVEYQQWPCSNRLSTCVVKRIFLVALITNHVYTSPPLLSYTFADPREVASASVYSSVSVPVRVI
jgi:hypothetical protein